MKMSKKQRLANVEKVRERMLTAMRKELKRNDTLAEDVLMVLAYTVGQCIAMQDQTKMTPDQAMDFVALNMQQGNMDAITQMMEMPTAGSA